MTVKEQQFIDVFPERMFIPQDSDKLAKEISKTFWQRKCIVTGLQSSDLQLHGWVLDGCHYYDSGRSKLSELKTLPLNLFPIASMYHTNGHDTFDYITFFSQRRKAEEKEEWLRRKVRVQETLSLVLLQLEALRWVMSTQFRITL